MSKHTDDAYKPLRTVRIKSRFEDDARLVVDVTLLPSLDGERIAMMVESGCATIITRMTADDMRALISALTAELADMEAQQ